jgi:hypothetical protein
MGCPDSPGQGLRTVQHRAAPFRFDLNPLIGAARSGEGDRLVISTIRNQNLRPGTGVVDPLLYGLERRGSGTITPAGASSFTCKTNGCTALRRAAW